MRSVVKVLVCGGRDFEDSRLLYDTLDKLHAEYRFHTIIHGDARGADRMAERWADDVGLTFVEVYTAEWEAYGRSAGYFRNQRMLDEGKPDLVVAFPGGKGTALMVELAKKAGVKVIEVAYEPL